MSNTLQWNSFDNLGLAFGRDVLEHRIRLMGLVAVAIQRVYRKHRSCSMMGAPAATAVDRKVRARELAQAIGTLEYRTGKPLALRQVARWLRNTYQPAHLAAQLPGGALEFRGYEKIDGTNLGCADDGELYGRRLQVSGKSYQKASLKCMEPIRACVADVKRALAEIIAAEPKPGTVAVPARLIPDAYASELNDGNDEDKDEEEDAGDGGASAAAAAAAASGAAAENADNQNIAIDFANVDDILKRVQVRLYGELGVPGNDTKFGYNTRPIANHWYCFGIVFHAFGS
ncbi:hypothetical protein CAOG_08742 [Capsaspora owczarzaki ATCC 30864]|uniref:hypothetical protein n=1 Tax=Capsaspora owczarzaki (strain ATCC 30864) TaxID=595528 RepID=UPI0003526762|nr:hypothetical protein CAOG_08742 [Capsaspora owczarzaki ATCC 30864]|eukprot:XP_011270362.1 hypothetical protein CAOG_08742 [Capsaspora owczarzaki ATCC 30864]